jgi:hypothetical protein
MFDDSISLRVARSFRDLDAALACRRPREAVERFEVASCATATLAQDTLPAQAWRSAIPTRSMTAPSG